MVVLLSLICLLTIFVLGISNKVKITWCTITTHYGGSTTFEITLPLSFSNKYYIPVGTSRMPKTDNSDYQFHLERTAVNKVSGKGQCATGLYLICIGY